MARDSRDEDHSWRFVTNHANVLECIATNPTVRLRDIATTVGITERTVAQIVSDLERAGYLTKIPVGRSNHYEVHGELPLRHPLRGARRPPAPTPPAPPSHGGRADPVPRGARRGRLIARPPQNIAGGDAR